MSARGSSVQGDTFFSGKKTTTIKVGVLHYSEKKVEQATPCEKINTTVFTVIAVQ